MTIITRSRISVDALEAITDLIRSGAYRPGDRLPGERQLAKHLSVSRASIREAIRRLETIGFVEIHQGVGTFVKAPGNEVLRAALVSPLAPDPPTLRKLFEIREIIEVEAAARAAQRVTAAQLGKMRYCLDELALRAARRDMRGAVIADVEFHRVIIEATGNDMLVKLVDNLIDLLREMRLSTGMFEEMLHHTIEDHSAVYDAIRRGDAAAAKHAMQAHLDHVKATTKINDTQADSQLVDR